MKKIVNNILQVVLSLCLGGAILYWMYRGFNFRQIEAVLLHGMDWTWMLLSFPFGILAQSFRGIRWRQTLEPLGEKPRTSVSIYSIFVSYATSLVIPRIGEVVRCGVLKRWEGVSLAKSLGTVVTERAIDSLLVLLITAAVLLGQLPVFMKFFSQTGTRFDSILTHFTTTGYIVTGLCALVTIAFIWFLIRRFTIYNKVKDVLRGLWQGITSLRGVRSVPLFIVLTLAIWVSYFLHYYLTFFCFGETKGLGLVCALVTFIVGSIAVIVPTPNGAGPWHFAVKTMLILYGVSQNAALYFVLIVHTIQTLLVVVLGIFGWIALQASPRLSPKERGD